MIGNRGHLKRRRCAAVYSAVAHLSGALLKEQALARLGLLHLCPVGCVRSGRVPVKDSGCLHILLDLSLLHIALCADQLHALTLLHAHHLTHPWMPMGCSKA